MKKHSSAFKPFLEYFEPQWVEVKKTQSRGKTGARVSWNCYHASLKGGMKATSTLEVSHKHMKSSFGMKPKFNTFYDHLKVQQLKTISAIKDMENRAPKKKKISKASEYQEKIQEEVKKKYKLAEIKEYLDNISNILAGYKVQPK